MQAPRSGIDRSEPQAYIISMNRLILLLIASLTIISCSSEQTISLWSDRREMADIVELYNKTAGDHRVIFQYKEELVSSFVNSENRPDIIIGGDLANSLIKDEMNDLSAVIGTLEENAALIPEALRGGTYMDDEVRLLPLSYSPLAVLFRKSSKRLDRSAPNLELTEMMELSLSFNGENKIGYSPYWDDEFLLTAMELQGSSFTGSPEKPAQWDEGKLNRAQSFLQGWNEKNGGRESVNLFNGKYMYDNRIKVLKEERILFTAVNLGDMMILSDAMVRDLDFLYLSHENAYHPGNIIYGGIYRKSGDFELSSQFLLWLLGKDNQEAVIASAIRNSNGTFGFLGGLSSRDDVNSLVLARYYPELAGKIPESSYLLPQLEKPIDYDAVKFELITPWLNDRIRGEALSLYEAMDKWEKLRIPF